MNIENMTKLADFLENLSEERFNIAEWVSGYEYTYDDGLEYYYHNILDINVCNTAGCIAGWAVCLMNDGCVSITNDEYSDTLITRKNHLRISDVSIQAAEWLGLDWFEAQYLFVPGSRSVWHRYADDYNLEHGEELVFYSNIHPKHAADMLRRIANNEIELSIKNEDM